MANSQNFSYTSKHSRGNNTWGKKGPVLLVHTQEWCDGYFLVVVGFLWFFFVVVVVCLVGWLFYNIEW